MKDSVSVEAQVVETIIKHLPPSGSTLYLLDLNGATSSRVTQRRDDLDVAIGAAAGEDCFDAVIGYDAAVDDDALRAALRALRPGGRLILIDPNGEPDAAHVRWLDGAGYTRILVEEMLPGGVLMRGEKPHLTDDTQARIQSVAVRDTGAELKGRYAHLLIRQTPNKPVWALQPGETVEWHALALADDGTSRLLAFSSLPKAVAFMQPAVVDGKVKDVNKVAKFSRAVVQNWRLWVNPPLDALDGHEIVLVPVDPTLAEAPDE